MPLQEEHSSITLIACKTRHSALQTKHAGVGASFGFPADGAAAAGVAFVYLESARGKSCLSKYKARLRETKHEIN